MSDKKIVNITVRDKIAKGDGTVFVCDNSDYRLRFDFDSDWDGLNAKTARMLFAGCYRDYPFTGNEVDLDRIPSTRRGLSIGVYAGDIKTTTGASFNCKFSVLSPKPTHEPPPEDVYNQIMELIDQVDDAIIDVDTLPLENINSNALYRCQGSIFHRYNDAWMELGGGDGVVGGSGTGGNGTSSVTPKLSISEDNYWQVSYDNGVNWVSLNVKATGTNGLTPHIGENGNWWIGDEDQEVKARVEEVDFDDRYLQFLPAVDEAEKSSTDNANRILSEYHLELLQKTARVYATGDSKGSTSPYHPIALNTVQLYHPYGYSSIEDMIAGEKWGDIEPIGNKHYVKEERIGGRTSYHPRLYAVAVQSIDGNLRTGIPRDSTDTINLAYLNSRLGSNVFASSNGSDTNDTLVVRSTRGEIRCKVDDTFDSTACVNRQYVKDRYATINSLKVTSANAPADSANKVKVVQALGGVKAGDDITDKDISSLVIKMLTNYEKFSVFKATAEPSPNTYEYGGSITITKVTPYFSLGTNQITELKIGSTSGTGDLYYAQTTDANSAGYVEEIKSAEDITLPTPKTFDYDTYKNSKTASIWCTLSDGKSTETYRIKYQFERYNYVGVTNDTTVPKYSANGGVGYASSIGTGTSVEMTNTGKYIWFLLPGAHEINKSETPTIEYKTGSGWEAIDTTVISPTYFTNAAGLLATYTAYRAEKKNITDTEWYRICSSPCYTEEGDGEEDDGEEGGGNESGGGNVTATVNYVITTTNTAKPTTTSIPTDGSSPIKSVDVYDGDVYYLTNTVKVYLWFLMATDELTQLQTYDINAFVNMDTEYVGTTTLNGGEATYYAYRTKYKLNPSTNEQYKIVKEESK